MTSSSPPAARPLRLEISAPPCNRRGRAFPGPSPLLLVLLLATALRAPGLALYPYEQDELYTVIESTELFDTRLQPGIDARPLYFLMQHVLLPVLPDGAVWLRLPALLFGLLGIWVTGRLAGRLFGTAAGTTAALLLAVAPWHLHISGMARYWSLVYLLAAAFFYFLARAYEHERPRDYLAALLSLTAGMLTHPTLLFAAGGAALGVSLVTVEGRLGWRWPSRRAWTLLWLPFLGALVVFAMTLWLTGNQSAVRNWDGRGWTASLRLIPAIVDWATPTVTAAALAGALLLVGSRRRPLERRWGAMSLGGCTLALLLLAVASFSTDVYADYAVSILPLAFACAGALAQMVGESTAGRTPGRALSAAVASVFVISMLPGTVSHLSSGTRFDFRPAYRYIAASAPQLPVHTWPLVVQAHYAPELIATPLHMDPASLGASLTRERDMWVVAPGREYGLAFDDSGEAERWLAANCTLRLAHERPRIDARRYRVELYRCTLPSSPSPQAAVPGNAV